MLYEDFVKTTDISNHDLQFYMDGMNEENGEISGVLKRIRRGDYGDGTKSISETEGVGNALRSNTVALLDFIKEVGDEHWYQTRALQVLGLSWSDVESLNMSKLKKRKETDTLMGKGDNRENE